MLQSYFRPYYNMRPQSLRSWARSLHLSGNVFPRIAVKSSAAPTPPLFLYRGNLDRATTVSLPTTRRIHDTPGSKQVNICHHHRMTNSRDGCFTAKRYIQSEREYISIVTSTLQTMHDTIDNVLDQQTFITDYEISFSQGVLTLKFPPHGTWVINQQTPNLQIWVCPYECITFESTKFHGSDLTLGLFYFFFSVLLRMQWSSPLSGPKRFEYDDNDKLWFSTKDGLNLGHALSQEIHHIYPDLDPIELNV